MKYIATIDQEGIEEIFLFPNSIDRDAMTESLEGIKIQTWGRVG